MRGIHRYALRTQFAAIVSFLVIFVLGASVSHWIRGRAQSESAAAVHRDLAIATKLPRLKYLLRRLELTTDRYLETGDPAWLKEHDQSLKKLDKTQQDLYSLMPEKRERAVLDELEHRLAQHFKAENGWIEQRRAGTLPPGEAKEVAASSRSYEKILETLLNMHDIRVAEFQTRRAAARRESVYGFAVVLAVGLLASALLSLFLFRYIIFPIRTLSDYARTWSLGEPWECRVLSVSPEINGLVARMRVLAERLNQEFRKEKDLGQLKTRLVATASHELNNALSVIYSAAASLEATETAQGDARREKMYRVIKSQSRSLCTAVSNLLNIGRLESGRLAIAKKKTDMGRVLRDCVALVEILAEHKELKLSTSLPEVPVPVCADPDALTMVLTNLLSNAIKYTPPGGSVSVGLTQDTSAPGCLRVYVRDTGIGVEPEEQERIFSGYYRTDRGKQLAKGFGIGLSLAKNIIEAHGGRLELESAQGRGSTFSFLLHVWAPDAAAEPKTEAADGARKTKEAVS